MSQSPVLIEALKRALKQRGITYARVAAHLALSEASVKRMFASRHFTLERLDAVCALMHLEISDLFQLLEAERQRITHLSEEQEKELVADPRLFLVAVCARNRLGFTDILARYDLEETELIRLLARLDRIRFLELLPGNRIRLTVAADFRWLPDGPVERYYARQVQEEFFRSRFQDDQQQRLFLTGMLSRRSRDILQRKLDSLARDFAELHREDCALPVQERLNTGLALALRPWELQAFRALERQAVTE